MKIYFGELNVARGLLYHESPLEFKIVIRKRIQSVQLLRSEEMRNFDRGNIKIEVSFNTIRQHGSGLEATYYTLRHPMEIKSITGPVRFVAENEAREESFLLENGAIQYIECSIMGNASVHKYEFIGTHFSKI